MIGAAIRRVEHARLLTGRGQFVDDLALPGVLYCALARSPHAHARIARVDAAGAAHPLSPAPPAWSRSSW
jgi:aerobic carbon-monoxide dehydrogenase large subunit